MATFTLKAFIGLFFVLICLMQANSVNAQHGPPPPGAFTLNPPQPFCSGTNSHFDLSWSTPTDGPNPSENSGYLVYIDGQYKYNFLFSTAGADPEPKNYNQTYTYQIEARTPRGSSWSNQQSAKAANCGPPPTFHQYQPALTCPVVNTPQIIISWERKVNDPALGYRVYYSPEGNPNAYGAWVVDPPSQSYVGTMSYTFSASSPAGGGPGMVQGTKYRFLIIAIGGSDVSYYASAGGGITMWASDSPNWTPSGGPQVWSDQLYGLTTTDCTPPGPFNITAIAPSCPPPPNSPGQIKLDWSNSNTATSYQVYYDDLSTPGIDAYNPSVAAPTLTQNLTGVSPNTNLIAGRTYGFIVGATKGPYVTYSNNSTWSNSPSLFGPTTYTSSLGIISAGDIKITGICI